jgi:hypothetical protein
MISILYNAIASLPRSQSIFILLLRTVIRSIGDKSDTVIKKISRCSEVRINQRKDK